MPYPPKHSSESPEDYLLTVLNDPKLAAQQAAADQLLIAAFHDRKLDIEKLRKALDAGANPSRVVWNGYPALHLAVMRRSSPAVTLLLQHGAMVSDVDARGVTALKEAINIDFDAAINLIKHYGGEQAAPVFESNYQTLIDEETTNIVKYGKVEQLNAAILLGADVNAKAMPPLLATMPRCDTNIVDVLLKAGADPTAEHSKYGNVFAQIWRASNSMLGSQKWLDFYAAIVRICPEHAETMPNPNTMTVADLLKPCPVAQQKDCTYLHHLIDAGKADFVMDVIRRDRQNKLTANDFLQKCGTRTLLEVIVDKGFLATFFSADVWQSRVQEMLSLEKHLSPDVRKSFDFNQAAADLRAMRFGERKERARLKGFYNNPFSGR